MREIYFTPNPDESSPIGLLEVPTVDKEPIHHNATYADLISRAIEVTAMEDPQARVVEALYRGSGIPRELVDHVESTVQELDVAGPVRRRLYDLAEADGGNAFSMSEVEQLGAVLERDVLDYIFYLTSDGLSVDASSGGFTAPLLHDVNDPLEFDKQERAIATELGTGSYALQTELVWRRGEGDVVRPVFLSSRQHFALGHLATDGTFEHIATILDRSHPARQPLD